MVTRTEPPDLLLVCHANRARSPMAAHLLRAWAEEHRVRPRPHITSSGVFAETGRPLLPEVHEFLLEHGVDDSTHESRPFDLDEARSAGMVVTFDRALLRAIAERAPALISRTFTLREVIRLTSSSRWEESRHDARDLPARLQWLRPRVAPGDDDTPDPVRFPHRAVRRLLEALVVDVQAAAPVLLGARQTLATP